MCQGLENLVVLRLLPTEQLLCRCLYEIGATPSSKLQLLTNRFNESGSFLSRHAQIVLMLTPAEVVMVPDISQHVSEINAETGESLSALLPFPWGDFHIVSCLL